MRRQPGIGLVSLQFDRLAALAPITEKTQHPTLLDHAIDHGENQPLAGFDEVARLEVFHAGQGGILVPWT